MHPAKHLLVIAASLGMVACAAPASVEGVFSGSGFELQCETPLAKTTASGRDRVVVMSEHDNETLSAVNVMLPGVNALPLGEAIEVGTGHHGDDRPVIDAVVGDLVIDVRSDGVEILSTEHAVRAASVGGTLTLDVLEDGVVSGSFRVDLDDGGYLDGTFAADTTDD